MPETRCSESNFFWKMANSFLRIPGASDSPILFFFSFLFFSLFCSSSSSVDVSYEARCSSIVPQSNRRGLTLSSYGEISILFLYKGSETIFGHSDRQSLLVPSDPARFVSSGVYATDRSGILAIDARLIISSPSPRNSSSVTIIGAGGEFRPRRPRVFGRGRSVSLSLAGFWNESSGELCMVGSGTGGFRKGTNSIRHAVLKLHYTKSSTITRSLATGILEFLPEDGANSGGNVRSLSMLAVPFGNHSYNLNSQPKAKCFASDAAHNEPSLKRNLCDLLKRISRFPFSVDTDPNSKSENHSVFGSQDGRLTSMMMVTSDCSKDGNVFSMLAFSNGTYGDFPFVGISNEYPLERTLIGEGLWNGQRDQLCFTFCRLLNHSNSLADAFVGDCTVSMNLSFYSVLTLENRKTVEGSIWSDKRSNESGYFDPIVFSLDVNTLSASQFKVKYEFTQFNIMERLCGFHDKNVKKHSGRTYPDGLSNGNMGLNVNVRNSHKQYGWAYLSPLANDEGFYNNRFEAFGIAPSSNHAPKFDGAYRPLNISYVLGIHLPPGFKWDGVLSKNAAKELVMISAEGLYDSQTGTLCMVGCRRVIQSNDTNIMDCNISLNFQLSPLSGGNSEAEYTSGTIKSTRKNVDPLYFEPLKMHASVTYIEQTRISLFLMEMEVPMVLISLTLESILVLLQLLYAKRHPEVLSFVSLVMTSVLTLGRMVPLLLNFEAFLANQPQKGVVYLGGGWVRVDEVLVRVMTMIAFLLQFRLLQLAWTARSNSVVSERRSFILCSVIYVSGGLVGCFFAFGNSSLYRQLWEAQHSNLDVIKSYAGLILDVFLLPQITLNLFENLREKTLVPSFFVGLTVVRSFPHVYDICRSFYNVPGSRSAYFYADPEWDFYSAAWDFTIPSIGVLFVIVICLQQRFGGRCILPRRLKERIEYQKVPVVS